MAKGLVESYKGYGIFDDGGYPRQLQVVKGGMPVPNAVFSKVELARQYIDGLPEVKNALTHLKSKELYKQGKKDEAYKMAQQDEGWIGSSFEDWSKWMEKAIKDSEESMKNEMPRPMKLAEDRAAEGQAIFGSKTNAGMKDSELTDEQVADKIAKPGITFDQVEQAMKQMGVYGNRLSNICELIEKKTGSKLNAVPQGGPDNLPAGGYTYKGHSMRKQDNYIRVDGLDDLFLKIEDAMRAIDDIGKGEY